MKPINRTPLLFCILLLCLTINQACKKDEPEIPLLETVSIIAVSDLQIKVTGKISNIGDYTVLDYGFIYSDVSSEVNIEKGKKVSLGSDLPDGDFSKEFTVSVPYTFKYSYEKKIYAKTYLTNKAGTIYGDLVSVDLSTKSISTSSMNPTSGKNGDRVTIFGNFAGFPKENIGVRFGGIPATIVSISPTELVFTVPPGIYSFTYDNNQIPVVATFLTGNIAGGIYYFSINDTFGSFIPKTGRVGDIISIGGLNISYSEFNNVKIYFGNVLATSYKVSDRENLTVVIPPNISSDKVQIRVEYANIKTTLLEDFTLIK